MGERVRFSAGSMRRAGIRQITGKGHFAIQCLKCGTAWTPEMMRGTRFKAGWWRCPKGCNDTPPETPAQG
jgi:hypothetical protein